MKLLYQILINFIKSSCYLVLSLLSIYCCTVCIMREDFCFPGNDIVSIQFKGKEQQVSSKRDVQGDVTK